MKVEEKRKEEEAEGRKEGWRAGQGGKRLGGRQREKRKKENLQIEESR